MRKYGKYVNLFQIILAGYHHTTRGRSYEESGFSKGKRNRFGPIPPMEEDEDFSHRVVT
jgi:hypothetical protein